MKRKILRAVKTAGPRGILSDDLFEMLYGDDIEGGPGSGKKAMYVLINQLNRNLASKGWRVSAPRGTNNRPQRYTLRTL